MPMQHYSIDKQDDFREISDLINHQDTCLLQTLSDADGVQTGIFNPLFFDGRIYFHVNQNDEQIQSIRKNGTCRLIFQDVLALLPSHWAEPKYAGAATTYYRFAELDCKPQVIEDNEEKSSLLMHLMQRFQPEGGHEPIIYASSIYRAKLEAILILECKIVSFRGKWKLGQNRSIEDRRQFIKLFKERNQGNDRRCAKEIQKWIEAHPE